MYRRKDSSNTNKTHLFIFPIEGNIVDRLMVISLSKTIAMYEKVEYIVVERTMDGYSDES